MRKYWGLLSGLFLAVLVFLIFIPAFAGKIYIDPVINLGVVQIRWYGIILAIAILAGYLVARKNSWKFGISPSNIDDYAFWAVIVGFLSARVYYVVFYYDYFAPNPHEIYKIWHGGLSIYGGVLGGLAFTYFYARKKAYTFWQLFDLAALSLPLAQAVGRLGNFVNQEAFGAPTKLPWKMYVWPQFRPEQFANSEYFHPAFLYEASLDVLVFFILYRLLGKTKSGILGLCYLAFYSLGRFFIEAIRLDSFFIGGVRVDQAVAFFLVGVSGILILYKQRKTSD